MTIEVIKQALDSAGLAMKDAIAYIEMLKAENAYLRAAIEEAQKSRPAQVSPLEFVTMVMEKEHLVGRPLFWAEWPNKEKNT